MNKRWYYLSLAIIIASGPFHQLLLFIIGLLMLIILLLIDIWAKYCLHHLHYQRRLSEQRALYGERITLSLALENAKLLPLPWVEIEDSVPRALPLLERQLREDLRNNKLLLESVWSIWWYERVTKRYTVRCTARGVHTFGPTVLKSGDGLGFLTREMTLSNWQYVLVYPLVVPLTRFGLPARHPFGERRAPRRLLEDPARVVGIREYAYGDSLRRVHWKATARTMQIQSKVYEATTTYTLLLFLNMTSQMDAWYSIHPGLEELAICATASVANWALDEGYAVGLSTNVLLFLPEEGVSQAKGPEKETVQPIEDVIAAQVKRRRIHLPAASSEEQRMRIMEALAQTQSYFGISIEEVLERERSHFPAGATVVVITMTISERLLDILERLRRAGYAVTILFVGDTPPPTYLAGITTYYLGGEETWEQLVSTAGKSSQESQSGFQL